MMPMPLAKFTGEEKKGEKEGEEDFTSLGTNLGYTNLKLGH